MKLIDKNTGKTLYSVLGGENLTLDEAIEWAGAEATEDQTYIIDGEEYSYEDLDWVANSYQPDNEPEEPKSWAVRIALLHEDYPYDGETKAYYGFDEAEEDARFIAARIDKWEDSHSRRSRRPDDLPTDGGVDGYEIAFESSPELHIILNTQPADDLLSAYVAESGNLLKVVDEDAEGESNSESSSKPSTAVRLSSASPTPSPSSPRRSSSTRASESQPRKLLKDTVFSASSTTFSLKSATSLRTTRSTSSANITRNMTTTRKTTTTTTSTATLTRLRDSPNPATT